MRRIATVFACLVLAAGAGHALAADWPYWRGPQGNNVSSETGLPSSWTRDGASQLWRDATWIGRSTPAVFDGRVCASGRTGGRLEAVACWNAKDGAKLWERRFPVYNTTIPYTRVGWANVTGDPETGYLYAQNGDGHLLCLDREGKTVWERRTGEELGRVSGYGGRTHTVLVDEDRVVLSVVSTGWGDLGGAVRQRYMGLDKRTGRVLWINTPNNVNVEDFNNQSNAIVAELGGRRVMVGGGADGWLYALDSRTGESIWRFHLSQKSLNAPVTVAGSTVYAAADGEPVNESFLGQVVAINGLGKGDITATNRLWHADAILAGFAAPVHDAAGNRLYVLDNSGNLHALDAKTGAKLYDMNVGTVGRGTPLFADGKLYVTEVNGHLAIVKPHADRFELLDSDRLTMAEGRQTELWGSIAAAYGRIYFMAEDGVYCLGDARTPYTGPAPGRGPAPPARELSVASGTPATVLLVPAEAQLGASEELAFELHAFDAGGRRLGRLPIAGATFALEGLKGAVTDGRFRPDAAAGNQAGRVKVTVGGKEGVARVRVFSPLPWSFDFEDGTVPRGWVAAGRFAPGTSPQGKTLHKAPAAAGLNRSTAFIGPADMKGYTIEADLKGEKRGRRMPDIGLVNAGYTLDLQGNHQRLQVRSWASELDFSKQVEFAWLPDTWYHMTLRVEEDGGTARVRGKVWKRDEPEPAGWTIEYDDASGIGEGAPGVYADSPTNVDMDNLKVVVNR
jgi:outer membrane protein assembly factor BamB